MKRPAAPACPPSAQVRIRSSDRRIDVVSALLPFLAAALASPGSRQPPTSTG